MGEKTEPNLRQISEIARFWFPEHTVEAFYCPNRKQIQIDLIIRNDLRPAPGEVDAMLRALRQSFGDAIFVREVITTDGRKES